MGSPPSCSWRLCLAPVRSCLSPQTSLMSSHVHYTTLPSAPNCEILPESAGPCPGTHSLAGSWRPHWLLPPVVAWKGWRRRRVPQQEWVRAIPWGPWPLHGFTSGTGASSTPPAAANAVSPDRLHVVTGTDAGTGSVTVDSEFSGWYNVRVLIVVKHRQATITVGSTVE